MDDLERLRQARSAGHQPAGADQISEAARGQADGARARSHRRSASAAGLVAVVIAVGITLLLTTRAKDSQATEVRTGQPATAAAASQPTVPSTTSIPTPSTPAGMCQIEPTQARDLGLSIRPHRSEDDLSAIITNDSDAAVDIRGGTQAGVAITTTDRLKSALTTIEADVPRTFHLAPGESVELRVAVTRSPCSGSEPITADSQPFVVLVQLVRSRSNITWIIGERFFLE